MSYSDSWEGNDITVKFPDGSSRTVPYFCEVEYDAPSILGSAWIKLSDLGVESDRAVNLGFASKDAEDDADHESFSEMKGSELWGEIEGQINIPEEITIEELNKKYAEDNGGKAMPGYGSYVPSKAAESLVDKILSEARKNAN